MIFSRYKTEGNERLEPIEEVTIEVTINPEEKLLWIPFSGLFLMNMMFFR
jgi:hypothetical protein